MVTSPLGTFRQLPDVEEVALRRILSLNISRKAQLTNDLRFMAAYKYNSYEVYNVGGGFFQSLLEWLNQFATLEDKETGLVLLRRLLFLSRREVLELSHVTYQNIIQEVMERLIEDQKLRRFDYPTAFRRLRKFIKRYCVFVGMSDGAQIDNFRRHGTDVISNEQVVTYYKLDESERKKHRNAKYAFLIDDMCGSGKTFLRREKQKGKLVVDGQIEKFLTKWTETRFRAIYFCPYIIAEKGYKRLDRLISGPRRIINRNRGFQFKIIPGMCIPQTYSILNAKNPLFKDAPRDRRLVKHLCEKYYDPLVEDEHTMKGGGCKYGFDKTGILLVRYSNTPNNTPSLVWYDSSESNGPRALFRRLPRHRT